MGLIKDSSYIEQIGIKETICATNMGHVIHILNNGKKYKEFGSEYQDLGDLINVSFKEELSKQTEEYNHPLISFPEIVISTEEKLFGIIGDYEIGTPLTIIHPNTSLKRLISLVIKMENEIERLSLKGWNLEDIHEENILINLKSYKKPIRIIDTDYYCFQPNRDKIELYRQNIKKIFRSFIISIIPNLSSTEIWLEDELQDKYFLASNGLMKTSDFLLYLIRKIPQLKEEPQNIKTLRKTL